MKPNAAVSTRSLGEFADVRCGDKGDMSILAVHPHSGIAPEWLHRVLRPEAIADHFAVPVSNVTVHEPTAIGSVVIVVRNRLYGGVTRSTTTDPHGKTYSYHLYELEVEEP